MMWDMKVIVIAVGAHRRSPRTWNRYWRFWISKEVGLVWFGLFV